MSKSKTKKSNQSKFNKNKFKTFFNKRKNIILIVLGLGLVFGAKYANAYYQEQKLARRKHEASQKQQELMKEFWQKKGLSEEQMQERMSQEKNNSNRENMTEEEREEMREKMEEKGFQPGMGAGMRMMH